MFFRSLAHKRRLEPSSLRTKHEKLFNEPGFRAFWPRKAKPGDKDKGEEGLCGRCYKIKTSLKREKGTSVFLAPSCFRFFFDFFPSRDFYGRRINKEEDLSKILIKIILILPLFTLSQYARLISEDIVASGMKMLSLVELWHL